MQRHWMRSLSLIVLISVLTAGTGCFKKQTEELSEVSEDSIQAVDEDEGKAEEKAEEKETPGETKDPKDPKKKADAETIFVYVCGQVINPGVYELSAQSRIYEAIALAGGVTDAADQTAVNQAEMVLDGAKIYVPASGETVPGASDGVSQAGNDSGGKVNLNTAGKDELMTLTGIGEAKADAILKYRETQGKFSSIEDLKNVEGIKDGVFQKVKDKISI